VIVKNSKATLPDTNTWRLWGYRIEKFLSVFPSIGSDHGVKRVGYTPLWHRVTLIT
jgi:hypothetical protein